MKDTTEIENRLIGHIINFDKGKASSANCRTICSQMKPTVPYSQLSAKNSKAEIRIQVFCFLNAQMNRNSVFLNVPTVRSERTMWMNILKFWLMNLQKDLWNQALKAQSLTAVFHLQSWGALPIQPMKSLTMTHLGRMRKCSMITFRTLARLTRALKHTFQSLTALLRDWRKAHSQYLRQDRLSARLRLHSTLR